MDARLAELDENLVRDAGTELDRAEWMKEQKELYEARNPRTRRGVAGGLARHGTASDTASFAEYAAERRGRDKRSVQREVQIASNLDGRAKEILRETPTADNRSELLRLSRAAKDVQAPAAELLARGDARTAAAAIRAIEDRQRLQDLRLRASAAPPLSEAWELIEGDCEAEL